MQLIFYHYLRHYRQGATVARQPGEPRQRAARDGRFKYLRINDNEFLFDVEDDTLERANLRDKHPEVFERLRAAWEQWNAQFLPITDEVITHGLSPDIQADRYVPDLSQRGM